VSQRGSHWAPDCRGFGDRQPKTIEPEGPVQSKDPFADHDAEAFDQQSLFMRSVPHAETVKALFTG
jgi:hypothetical protein